ncbi:uncharacterized protein SAMN05444487_10179 [Marininema mesophilum]|uniref:DUF177 domain-containing protein n=1 Tax=Marininema mesophilum TaxID=1048340 RepID=A0A1H2Q3I8_9BACL|nr:DUF177 domain-containing protein [Marininema mesophilum]SDW01368.1 uncharacterized protein SAMN05444487_10179 [Marininema mesophilum]
MRITFRELDYKPGPIEKEGTVMLEGLEKETPDLLRLDPLKVRVTAWKEQEVYPVQGKQSTNVELRCSRCLTSFDQSLEMDWFETFADSNQSRSEVVGEEEEDETLYVDIHQPTDITPVIEQALLLSLPFAPICTETCKGLCPHCGTNWNHESCQCDRRRVDPRMAKLEELLKRED